MDQVGESGQRDIFQVGCEKTRTDHFGLLDRPKTPPKFGSDEAVNFFSSGADSSDSTSSFGPILTHTSLISRRTMHPSSASPNGGGHTTESSERPVKRAKVSALDSKDDSTFVRRHPLGLRPSGNAYTSSKNLKDSCGLFATLPDELIAGLLEYLQPKDLLRLGGTCRALHAFTRNEELWRNLFVE